MYKKIGFSVITLGFFVSSFSQSSLSSPQISLYEHNPRTPVASGLSKYLEIPVNMSSGLPSIQLPLFTIKTGNITLPITLKYHAGGLKVNELASWVGMGWSLDVGGTISKRVNGLDDFFETNTLQFPYFTFAPNNNLFHPTIKTINEAVENESILVSTDPIAYKTFLGRIAQGNVDGEADEFLFSTPEGSGKIVYHQGKNIFQTDQLNGWKAFFNQSMSPLIDAKWDIKGTNGINYHFGQIELEKHPLIYNPPMGQSIHPYLPSSWHLSEISDFISGKGVQLYYDSPWKIFNTGNSYTWDVSSNNQYAQAVGGYFKESQEVTVNHIVFDNGKVEFIPQTTVGSPLKEMRVLDNDNKIVKRFLFDYFFDTARLANGQPNPQGLTLFLKSVQEISIKPTGDTLKIPPYQFSYNFNHHVPLRFSYAQDIWGFYNGKLSNPNLIPNSVLLANNIPWTAADRSIDTSCTKAGIIQELVNPTGGKSIFEFENNHDADGLTGGLRIKKISNYDPLSEKLTSTEYEYKNNNGIETGVRIFKPKLSYMYHHMSNNGTGDNMIKIYGQSIAPLFAQQGSPITYAQVNKKEFSIDGALLSKHYFLNPIILEGGYGEGDGVPHNKSSFDDKRSSLNQRTEIYRRDPGNIYTLIKNDETVFSSLKNYDDKFWNIQAAWAKFGTWTTWDGNDPFNQPGLNMDVKTNFYRQFRESTVPVEKTQIDYSGLQTIVNRSLFEYDTSNSNIRVVKTTNSEGDSLFKITKYAPDYQLISPSSHHWNNVIESIMSLNLISSPIEITTFIKKYNTTQLLLTSATLLEYSAGKVNKVYRIFTEKPLSDFQPSYNDANGFYFDSRYTLFQQITQVDGNNNPLTVISDSKTESYLWNYQASLPVANIKNATNSQVAYTSFETASTGNWTINGGAINTTNALTGSKGYTLSSGNSITSITLSAGNYRVSYWSKNGSMQVNGLSGIAGRSTSNGWTYFEHNLSSVTSLSLSGAGTIDELRMYPENAQMASVNYHPLTGITSMTDINNNILYYVYDEFNRLQLIKDVDGNIIKKICYNYQGQEEDCVPVTVYANEEQSQVFTRNNCGGCSTGSQVSYTVPANTYTSTISIPAANQLALNDISANGQNYANTNGTCTSSSDIAITYNNTVGASGFTALYTNLTTNQTYSFSIPGTGSGTLGCVPPGYRYSLSITKPGNQALWLFGTGCQYITGTSAFFSMVRVTDIACNTVTLEGAY